MYHHFKQYGLLYVLAVFCLITSLVAGATAALKVASLNNQTVTIVGGDCVQGMVRNLLGNAAIIIVLFASGPFYAGVITAPTVIGYLGFEAGYSMMFLILNQKIKGVIFSILGLAIANTFLFICMTYAAVTVCSLSLKKIHKKVQGIKGNDRVQQKHYFIRFLLVLISVVIISVAKVFLQQLCGNLLY
jgi:hypothetical protein